MVGPIIDAGSVTKAAFERWGRGQLGRMGVAATPRYEESAY